MVSPLDDPPHRGERAFEIDADAPLLVGFAARQRDGIDMLVDAHQPEAQVGLARIALGVLCDEAPAHPVAQKRRRARIEEGGPDHVAGDGEVVAPDMEGEAARQRPQHADEGDEQDRGLEQADAEIGRKLGEVAGILVHALVGIDADRPGIGEAEGAPRSQPLSDEIAHEAFAQLQLGHLAEPPLRDVEYEKATGDDAEHPELRHEAGEIAARQRVVEGLVPAVQPDLPIGRGDDDQEDGAGERQKAAAKRRGEERRDHHAKLRDEPRVGGFLDLGRGAGDLFRTGFHHGSIISERRTFANPGAARDRVREWPACDAGCLGVGQ